MVIGKSEIIPVSALSSFVGREGYPAKACGAVRSLNAPPLKLCERITFNRRTLMPNKPVALVTGANQGIGLQIAKDLVPQGFTVLVGSRDFAKGRTAAKSIGADAHAAQLDVTDHKSIAAAAERIAKEFGRLDVLIQNAAISNTSKQSGQSVEDYSKTTGPSVVAPQEMRAVWDTNVFGVLCVDQAMLPLLRATLGARIVNVSRSVGTLTATSDPADPYRAIFGPVYPASKTALNALTVAMAPEGIRVEAVSPWLHQNEPQWIFRHGHLTLCFY
jgi:NAD(P)-dependent dehydrogenase (short-subunit alcohol dehydrogenase family)